MKIAALADLHLGFRAYAATEGGRNAREVDVERALARAVDQIIAAQPDVITIAGDIFHHPRVSDFAKKAFLDAIRRLLLHTHAVIIILQGNHDAGKSAEILTPIMLAEGMSAERLFVVLTPERIRFRTLGKEVAVACFPFTTMTDGAVHRLDPDPDADVNVLLMHAAVRGSSEGDTLPYFYGGDQALDVAREVERWDVIACGDYHEFTRLHPSALAFYSGSIERTSSNIWDETAPKGWVLVETNGRQLLFQPIQTRPMLDCDQYNYQPATAESVSRALENLVGRPEVEGAIVRMVVDDFPREEKGAVDWGLVRQIKAVAAHFQLDLRYKQMEHADPSERGHMATQRSLLEEAAAYFADDPAEVRELAMRHLDLEAA